MCRRMLFVVFKLVFDYFYGSIIIGLGFHFNVKWYSEVPRSDNKYKDSTIIIHTAILSKGLKPIC